MEDMMRNRLAMRKLDYDPNLGGMDPEMFGLGQSENLEKSSGHPLLDRISTAFRELDDAKATAAQYDEMLGALAGEVTGVKMNLVLVITSGKLTKEEMLASALEGNPTLAAQLEANPTLRAQVDQEMDEILTSGKNRQDRAFQFEAPITVEHARAIVAGLAEYRPTPQPGELAKVLQNAANQVYDPDWKAEV